MPQRAERLFELFKDTDIDMSFAAHTSDEKETFKSIAKSVLCRLGKVVLDLHQFSSVEEQEYKPAASSIVSPEWTDNCLHAHQLLVIQALRNLMTHKSCTNVKGYG